MRLSKPSTQANQLSTNEQIIREVEERKRRESNIIIFGTPEQNSTSTEERPLNDEREVHNITSMIDKDIPSKVFCIGKYNLGKTRKVKVCFGKPESTKVLLRNKEKLPDSLKVFSDQTPAQQNYFLNIKDELS